MDTTQNLLKKLATICLVAMGVLFILGCIYYKERVLFSDATFYFINIVNNNSFYFPHDRYGCFITELLPYLGQKMHLSLYTLIFFYGMSFYLFYFIIASLLVLWLKQYRLAILMTFYYFLFVSQSFIWNSEIPQSVAWMFLLLGVTIHLGNKKTNIFLLLIPFILLAFITLYTHFVVMIPTTFLWVFFIIEKKNWPFSRKNTVILSCFIVLIVVIKFLIVLNSQNSGYETNNLHGITHMSIGDILPSLYTPVIKMFIYRCIINYWTGLIIFFIGIINLIKNKQYILALWTLLCFVGYFVVMGLTYGDLDKNFLLIHAEIEWSCIAIIAASPWVYSYLSENSEKIITWSLGGVLAVRLTYIIVSLPMFTARLQLNEQIVSQMRKKGITKLVIYSTEHLRSVNILDWAIPFESLVISQIAGDRPQRTFILVNKDNKELIERSQNEKTMQNTWGSMNYNEFNHKYFEFDTTHGYHIIAYEELMK